MSYLINASDAMGVLLMFLNGCMMTAESFCSQESLGLKM